MPHRPSPAARGFSLIEMLIVVGIIAVLGAVLFPVVSKMADNMGKAKCISNLRQLGGQALVYSADSGSLPPPGPQAIQSMTGYSIWDGYALDGMGILVLQKDTTSLHSESVLHCPSNKIELFTDSKGRPDHANFSYAPAEYGGWMNYRSGYMRRSFPGESPHQGIRLAAVNSVMEERYVALGLDVPGSRAKAFLSDVFTVGDWVHKVHGSGVNVFYPDGSVKSVRDTGSGLADLANPVRSSWNNEIIDTFWAEFDRNQ